MARFHLIIGILLFIAFAVTGVFMRIDFPDKDVIPQELRLLMRSRHIYIVFSSLIHLALGFYCIPAGKWARLVQYLGSGFLIVSSVLLLAGFIAETYYYATFSEVSRFGIYTSLSGIIVHGIASQIQER